MRCWKVGVLLIIIGVLGSPLAAQIEAEEGRRVGIIGLDTSHSGAFTDILNKATSDEYGRYRVVAAYPYGSREIESSARRIPEYTEAIRAKGVEVVDSIEALLSQVDVVLLETNDGRLHLEQVRPVLAAGKRVFVDKPLGGTLAQAVAILAESERTGVPVFTASGLRYGKDAGEIREGKYGRIWNAFTFSPASLEPTHPDLFWYAIHAVELLYAVMGEGCESVVRVQTETAEVVVGTWEGGRTGTVQGLRGAKGGYGGIAFGTDASESFGGFDGYQPLVRAITRFWDTGVPPVAPSEMLEIYTFMEAADESLRRGGVPVRLDEVLAKARQEAKSLLE